MTNRTRNRTKNLAPPTEEMLRKQRDALELRRAGASYNEIAHKLGYADKAGAHKAVRSGIRNAIGSDTALEVRQLEADRLDRLQIAVWEKAMTGSVPHVESVLKIMNHRANLLGLYHSHGIAERAQALDEMNAALIAGAIGRILDELHLTPEQQALVGVVVPQQLRAITQDGEMEEETA